MFEKGGTDIIPSCPIISSQLKKSPYKGGVKTVLHCFLSPPASKKRYETLKYAVVTGLDYCHFYGNVLDILSFV